MSEVIVCKNVVKSFGNTLALDGLQLSVDAGSIHGFLGPNGAGKTTTMRILLGLLKVDAGEVRLLQGDAWQESVKLHRRLSYIPGDVSLWPELSGGETIDLLCQLHGKPDRTRIAELMERFELDARKKIRAYSKGNRQKVALVSALASNAELLILDEPSSGLDPLMEAVFQQCMKEERNNGRTILLSSHILAEVEAICDHVTIIRKGKTVESGTIEELRHLSATFIRANLSKAPSGLEELQGVHDLQIEGSFLSCRVDSQALDEFLARLIPFGIASLNCQPPTLEDLFMRHYRSEIANGVRE